MGELGKNKEIYKYFGVFISVLGQKTKANILFGLSDRHENCNRASQDGDFITSFTLLSSSAYQSSALPSAIRI